MSDQDEYLWHLEVQLSDALEREKLLTSQLHTSQLSTQELQCRADSYKQKYQRLDDLLEAEEAKTLAERSAREAAEERTRGHLAAALKSQRDEETANQHCEAAEVEIMELQTKLSVERSATATASELCARLHEDLQLAEANETAAYDQLDAARAKVSELQHEISGAANELRILKSSARGFEEMMRLESQRAKDAEDNLSLVLFELRSNEIRYGDLLDKYTAREAAQQRPCSCTTGSASATLHDTADNTDTHSPLIMQQHIPLAIPTYHPLPSPSPSIFRNTSSTTLVNSTWSSSAATYFEETNNPIDHLPALPSRAFLRPATASTTAADHDVVEEFKGKCLPARRRGRDAKKQQLWRRCSRLWGLPVVVVVDTLQLLFGGGGGLLDVVEGTGKACNGRGEEEHSWALLPPYPGR